MGKTIVIRTGGKHESVDTVSVHLFDTKVDAEIFCAKYTDSSLDEKYWRYCEIIEQNKDYEMARYENYDNGYIED